MAVVEVMAVVALVVTVWMATEVVKVVSLP